MPASLATLSVSLSNEQAIADAKATGAAFEEMGNKGEQARDKLGRFTSSSDSVADALKRQSAAAAAAGGAFQSSGSQVTDHTRHMTLLQIEAIKMNDALDKGNKHLGFWDSILQKATQHSGEHTIGIGKLERGFEEMSVKALGANRIVGLLGATTLKFGVGTVETVGILGGLALITFAWEKLTETVRAADKAQDEAAASALSSLRTHVGGPGGAFADQMTGAIGKSQDIGEEIKQKSSFWEALKSGSFMSFNLNPSDRQDQVTNLANDKAQYDLAVKWLKVQKDLADAKQYANSVTTPYDRAVSRGTSISGFYTEAMAAEAKLTELAKSGTFEVRDAAIQALGALDKIVTHRKLIDLGLAESPSQVGGIESGAALGALKATGGTIGAAFKTLSTQSVDQRLQYGGQIGDLTDQIDNFSLRTHEALKEHKNDWTSVGVGLRAAAKDAQTYYDAVQVALHPDRAGSIGAGIRGAQRDNGAMAFVQSSEQYGANLSAREAALKLPAVFDAVREAAVKLGEALRTGGQKVELGLAAWGLSHVDKVGNTPAHWNFDKGAIGGGLKAGVTDAAGDALAQFSPQAIAYSLASKAINFAVQGLTDLGASLLGVGASATEARRAQRQLTDEYNAAVAAFRHDDLSAALAQNLATYEQLVKQTNDTLGNVSTLIHGGADAFNAYKKAIGDLSEQAKRNAALATQQAAEQKQYAQEDLNVRNLRATGHGDQADRLALQEKQAREMQAAREKALADGVIDLSERLYLQTLATTQNNELLAFLNGTLADATRNSPTGFYAEAYMGQYITARGAPPSDSIGYDSAGWQGANKNKGAPSGSTTIDLRGAQFTLAGGTSKEVYRGFISILKQKAASSGGDGSLSDALDSEA